VVRSVRLLRIRFICTFKRDKLHQATENDKRLIDDGNSWAHGVDARVDAQLYEGVRRRNDHSVYKRMYGMFPQVVTSVCKLFQSFCTFI